MALSVEQHQILVHNQEGHRNVELFLALAEFDGMDRSMLAAEFSSHCLDDDSVLSSIQSQPHAELDA